MSDPQDWPDGYVAVSGALAGLGATVGAEAPADAKGSYSWLPFIRVTILGGPDDRITSICTAIIDVFANKRGPASQLAGKVRQRMLHTPHLISNTALIDDVRTVVGPSEIPYGDVEKVRCYSATYRVEMRRY